MSGNCDVLDDADLLEEILVRVPHESISNCILVSKRWFGLIRDPSFLEHYIRRWSDEAKLMKRWLRSHPVAADVSVLQHRLQSQQLAALDRLQHLLAPIFNNELQQLHSKRVDAVNKLDHNLQYADELYDEVDVVGKLKSVNDSQQQCQSRVKESLKQLPPQRLAPVNQTLHQVVCELLIVVNEVGFEQYRDMVERMEQKRRIDSMKLSPKASIALLLSIFALGVIFH